MKITKVVYVTLLWPALVLAQAPALQPSAEETKAVNAKIVTLNDLLAQINGANDAKDWPKAKQLAGQGLALDAEITAQHPAVKFQSNRHVLYKALGDANLYLGQYQDAINAYETSAGSLQSLMAADSGEQTDAKAGATSLRRTLGQVLTNEGNAYLKLHRTKEATQCYTRAAETVSAIDSKLGATAWFNLCATLYNTGDVDATPAACDKAIAADPTRADAYFVKASVLFVQGKDVNGKFVAPPESIAALKKYMELAPDGAHASDVKQMLAYATTGK
jgi:tetratricopeptide (TPR) repeat protein